MEDGCASFICYNNTDIIYCIGFRGCNQQDKTKRNIIHSSFEILSEVISQLPNTIILNTINAIYNDQCVFYLNNILRPNFPDLLYVLTIFYLYDLKNGRASTVIYTADVTNISKFACTFFVISKVMVLRQCLCGVLFPSQSVTKYRTQSWIFFF